MRPVGVEGGDRLPRGLNTPIFFRRSTAAKNSRAALLTCLPAALTVRPRVHHPADRSAASCLPEGHRGSAAGEPAHAEALCDLGTLSQLTVAQRWAGVLPGQTVG